MTPIASHITAFLRERLPVERMASPNTCDTYAYAFQLLFEFASTKLKVPPSDLCLEQLDASLVLAFLAHLENERGCCPSSRNARLTAIKSFFKYVQYRVPSSFDQVRSVLAVPIKNTQSRLVSYLTVEEMKFLLNTPDPNTRDGIRDRGMLQLAFDAGLRLSELVHLRLDDVSFQPTAHILVRGKGRRERQMPMCKETSLAMRTWLAVRGKAPAPELFLNAAGTALTRSGFVYILAKHGPSQQIGLAPSIALAYNANNNYDAAIEVHQGGQNSQSSLWFQLGYIAPAGTYPPGTPLSISWLNATQLGPGPLTCGVFLPCFTPQFDYGYHPTVAADNNLGPASSSDSGPATVVEVHQSAAGASTLYYHVGVLTVGPSPSISWGPSLAVNSTGYAPTVSVANNMAVLVFEGSAGTLLDSIGAVDTATSTIAWTTPASYGNGYNPTVSMFMGGTAAPEQVLVEAHQVIVSLGPVLSISVREILAGWGPPRRTIHRHDTLHND